MKRILILHVLLVLVLGVSGQTYVHLVKNTVINSNSNIKILGGHYTIADSLYHGVIQINNDSNVVVDGDSVYLNGAYFMGYMVLIHNSKNITIKNFRSAKGYFYALHADSSKNITVTGCNFSLNKKDTIGFLSLSDDESLAYGGGIEMHDVGHATIAYDTAQFQNDGIALYNSYNDSVYNNLVSYNNTYGIRMFYTDSSIVIHNDASHIKRYTDPSDCASILLYFSRLNKVTNNNCSYGGDGIFTNANINLPNSMLNFHDDNYFAYNNCSYSPHNAMESVFTDGNVFKHNNASYSNYGLWGGYAINTVADSNTLDNNSADGIAIEHGMNNIIQGDSLENNGGAGVHFWADGIPISGYSGRLSHNGTIGNNYFQGNAYGVEVENTDSSKVKGNSFKLNSLGIQLENSCLVDSLNDNFFIQNVYYNIKNKGTGNVQAQYNNYSLNDSAAIDCKIFDFYDSAACGIAYWQPYTLSANPLLQLAPPTDLCESTSAFWMPFVQDGLPTTLSWDNTDFVAGTASLKCVTQSGFQVRLHYFPAGDSTAKWDLSKVDTLHISFKAIDTNAYGFQQCAIRIGSDCGGYIEYDNYPDTIYKPYWRSYAIPLAGNAAWSKNISGSVSLSDISYVEVIADTWGYGFTWWTDGLYFTPQPLNPAAVKELSKPSATIACYPNPCSKQVNVVLPSGITKATLEIINCLGQQVYTERLTQPELGNVYLNTANLPAGFYTIVVQDKRNNQYHCKLVIQ
jgi:parallel beta-helix repeat protein